MMEENQQQEINEFFGFCPGFAPREQSARGRSATVIRHIETARRWLANRPFLL
jgi:hypothetical protein